jgi:hypothetical protein
MRAVEARAHTGATAMRCFSGATSLPRAAASQAFVGAR